MRLGIMGDTANKNRSVPTELFPLMINGSKPPIVPRSPTGMIRINPPPIMNGCNGAWVQSATRFYQSGRAMDAPITDANLIVNGSDQIHLPDGVAGSTAAVNPPQEGVADHSDMMRRHGFFIDPVMENRRAKRVISNRLSAQRSRFRKLDYVFNAEKKLRELQAEIIGLIPTIENERNEKKRLEMENILLKEKLSFLEQESKHSKDEIEKNREEVQSLREINRGQQCKGVGVEQHLAPVPVPVPAPGEVSGSMEQSWDNYKFDYPLLDSDILLEDFDLDDPIIKNLNF